MHSILEHLDGTGKDLFSITKHCDRVQEPLFLKLTGDAISRYWKSSLQFGMVQTLIRISFNSWILTEPNFSVEVPQFGAGR